MLVVCVGCMGMGVAGIWDIVPKISMWMGDCSVCEEHPSIYQ